jgi:ethanolamine ammonia-lyase small subunit|tara:strand:+ start:590 stop:775 length:186 start_codon:yes stop_codon:yes gene_type:complete
MAKELKEIVEEIIKDMIQDGKIEVQDDNGEKIEDLSIGVAEEESIEDYEDIESDDDSDNDE